MHVAISSKLYPDQKSLKKNTHQTYGIRVLNINTFSRKVAGAHKGIPVYQTGRSLKSYMYNICLNTNKGIPSALESTGTLHTFRAGKHWYFASCSVETMILVPGGNIVGSQFMLWESYNRSSWSRESRNSIRGRVGRLFLSIILKSNSCKSIL